MFTGNSFHNLGATGASQGVHFTTWEQPGTHKRYTIIISYTVEVKPNVINSNTVKYNVNVMGSVIGRYRMSGKMHYKGGQFNIITITRAWEPGKCPEKSVRKHLNGPLSNLGKSFGQKSI